METHPPEVSGAHHSKREGALFFEKYSTPLSILSVGIIVAGAMYYRPSNRAPVSAASAAASEAAAQTSLQEAVLPAAGVTLPITWGDLGAQMVADGAIDPAKMAALYKDRGGFPPEFERMLEKNANDKVVMTNQNAGFLLNLFWALGLANKNPILTDKTDMMNPAYGGAGHFASTGGWILAKGNAMDHYNMHELMMLTSDEQAIVDRVSRGIFRPCCGNSTHFPDCNHGMAMLGLLELMASQGVSEQDMYKTALSVNSFWFPETYLTIATYMQEQGTAWKDVSPKEMLSAPYSSSTGYQNITAKVKQLPQAQSAGGCSA